MRHKESFRLTPTQIIGALIAGIFLLPAIELIEGGQYFSGYIQTTLLNVLLFAALGGALATPLLVEKSARLRSIIPGIIAGVGAQTLLVLYLYLFVNLLGRTKIYKLEMMIIIFLGAIPGIYLTWRSVQKSRMIAAREHGEKRMSKVPIPSKKKRFIYNKDTGGTESSE